MTKKSYFFISVLAVVAMIPVSFFLGQQRGEKRANLGATTQIDTIYRTDTLTVSKPVYLTKRITDTMLVAVTDTIRERDTLYIALPREEKVYQDSTYRAVVSGYKPSLDTITVYQHTETIYKTVTVPVKKHWGVGVQVGAGVSNGGLSPYIGVGVSYNLLTF